MTALRFELEMYRLNSPFFLFPCMNMRPSTLS